MLQALGNVHEFDAEIQVVLNSLGRERADVSLFVEEYNERHHSVHKKAFLGTSEAEVTEALRDLREWVVDQLQRMGESEAAQRLTV